MIKTNTIVINTLESFLMYKAHKMNLIKNLRLFSKQNLKPWNRFLKDLDVRDKQYPENKLD